MDCNRKGYMRRMVFLPKPHGKVGKVVGKPYFKLVSIHAEGKGTKDLTHDKNLRTPREFLREVREQENSRMGNGNRKNKNSNRVGKKRQR